MKTKEAIDHYGGIKKLAEALSIWPHVIYRWGESPPLARQYELEVKTNGQLKVDKSQENQKHGVMNNV